MSEVSSCGEAYVDPRVRRTRLMLEQALEDLLKREPLEKISVGDIAEAATLNRATFYAHFVDKFDLLEGMVASRFEGLLRRRGVVFDGGCPTALYGIALAVCDFLADSPYCFEQRQMSQHLELAMVGIVRRMLGEGIRRHPPKSGMDPEMVAAAVAGAIYGAARQWVRTEGRVGAEEASRGMMEMLGPMMVSS